MPFNLKRRVIRYVRVRKDPNSTCVDSALQIVSDHRGWSSIRSGLQYIQAFLKFVRIWEGDDEAVRKHLQEVVTSIEDAFEMAGLQIQKAIKKGGAGRLDAFKSKLKNKIKLFKARIREAKHKAHYASDSDNSIQSYSSGEPEYPEIMSPDDDDHSVPALVRIIVKKYELVNELEWKRVYLDLLPIEIFLHFVKNSSDATEVVRSDVCTIDEAFKTASLDIEDAITNGDGELLYALSLSLRKKIKQLVPEICRSYELLSDYAFRITPSLPHITDPKVWPLFGNSTPIYSRRPVEGGMEYYTAIPGFTPIACPRAWSRFCDLPSINGFGLQRRNEFDGILDAVKNAGDELYVQHDYYKSADRKQLQPSDTIRPRALGYLIQGVAFGLARVQVLCSGGKLSEEGAINMIWDLLQRIRPASPEMLEMYMGYFSPGNLDRPMGLMLPLQGYSVNRLWSGLRYLLEYLLESYSTQPKDEKLLRSDIEKVVFEVSLKYSNLLVANDDCHDLIFQLLQTIELLRVEIVLTKFIRRSDSILKGTYESIYKGLSSVQTFLLDSRPGLTLSSPQAQETLGPALLDSSLELVSIFKRIERVARDVEPLHLQYQGDRVNDRGIWYTVSRVRRREDPVKANEGRQYSPAFKFKLFLEFKLLKIQAVLTDQMRCFPSLKVLVKDEFSALNAGLELLLECLSLFPSENQGGDQESILGFINNVEAHPCYNVRSDKVPENFPALVSTLLQTVNGVNSEITGTVSQFQRSIVLTLPRTQQGFGVVDIFYEKLVGILRYKGNFVGDILMKRQTEAVLEELGSLRLEDPNRIRPGLMLSSPHAQEMKDIWGRVIQATYEADHVIDWILLVQYDWYHVLWLSSIIDEMKGLRREIANYVEMKNDGAVQTSKQMVRAQILPREDVHEADIPLKDQEDIIIDQLLSEVSKSREVVTIYGMPGIGKTTLAKNVYKDPLVRKHFDVHAWCCVSQAYRKRERLLEILSYVTESTSKEMDEKTDDELLDLLYQDLKGKRYLVVMDDVWETQAWEELNSAFPENETDQNGSKILMTTRNEEVGSQAQDNCFSHPIRSLNADESWELLRRRIFVEDECPQELQEIGREIAIGCRGLPLSLVAIAGVLRTTERKPDLWKEIERDLNSRILQSPEDPCMSILELSYQHLPDELKPCFLYFAAFVEGSEVPVQKLIQYWIAEGFVRQVGDEKPFPEDLAEIYVKKLISRCLVMAVKTGCDGGVRACKIHSLIYKLVLKKVEDDNFLQHINEYERHATSSNKRVDYGIDMTCAPIPVSCEQHRVSVCSKRKYFAMLKPSGSHVRTLLFSPLSDANPRCPYDEISFLPDMFKILKMLDIESINFGSSFPKGIQLIYPLRFLAISGDISSVPSEVGNLWNLETFIVKGLKGSVELPDTLWSMSRMRQLHVSLQATFKLQDGKLENSSKLNNMVSLSWPLFSQGDNSFEMMKLFPKLRKLRCILSEEHTCFPFLDFLSELESLKIIYYGSHCCQLRRVQFPLILKRLSLSDFSFTWEEFSAIGQLANLSILKLVSISFDSHIWKMKDGEFKQLQYLKLDSLKITEWHAEHKHLPRLQQLVLRSCNKLKEVPSSFGRINTLQMIELKRCSPSAKDSVMEILQTQIGYSNNSFKVFINGLAADMSSTDD